MSDTVRYVRIQGDAEKPVEKVINDLKKNAAEAGRYGHDVEVSVVDESQIDEPDVTFE